MSCRTTTVQILWQLHKQQQNLDQALSAFTASNSSGNGYGFFNVSVGKSTAKVNAIALCRGDVGLPICRSCLSDSSYNFLQVCPNQKEALGGCNGNNISNVDEFNKELGSLLNNLKNQAASGGSLLKYATRNVSFGNFQTIYGLVQFTPDLTETECGDCVDIAREDIRTTSPPSPSPPSTNTTGAEGNKSSKSLTVIIIVVVAVVISAILLTIMITFYIRKTKKKMEIEG
ncbi:Gnk2-homologous domain [Dillenia turbinata]|uniref:Gnk2-homologous domain n=1 Tax=Dillenia turbinata TaxID=194707 RepID=A0AAN8VS78_9MAGN